jgi:acyl-CoA synthetase (AMP-forming)/AMP-acid ligase II
VHVPPSFGGETAVFVARSGRYLGSIVLCDTLKSESEAAIAALRTCGVRRTVMLTGDRAESAKTVARALKIDEWHAQLLPEDKVRAVGYRDAALVAYEGPRGARLGLVIAGESEPPLAVRSKLLKVFPKGTVPRKVRFVAELPRNPQGKVTASSIKAILETER